MSFDPNKAKTPCGVASQHSLKFLPQVSIALVAFLRLTTCTTGRDSHNTFTVPSNLEIPVMHLHRSDDRQQFRTIVRLLTPRQGEGAISVVVDTQEYSTARSSEPSLLIADTCSISPGHDAVVAPAPTNFLDDKGCTSPTCPYFVLCCSGVTVTTEEVPSRTFMSTPT